MKLKFPQDKGLYKTEIMDWAEDFSMALHSAKCSENALDGYDEWIATNKVKQVQEFLEEELTPAIYQGARQKMKTIHKIQIDKRMPYRVKNLIQCITDSLDVTLEFLRADGKCLQGDEYLRLHPGSHGQNGQDFREGEEVYNVQRKEGSMANGKL